MRAFATRREREAFVHAHSFAAQRQRDVPAPPLHIDDNELEHLIHTFIQQHEASLWVRRHFSTLDVHAHELVDAPRDMLARCCQFFALRQCDAWIDACAPTIASQVFRSRDRIAWPAKLRSRLNEYLNGSQLLREYVWDEEK